jgi:ornithine carbamoyltransferase
LTSAPPERASAARHFLTLPDFTSTEIRALLEASLRLKQAPELWSKALAGRTLALLFRKSSTRTRVSFEAGMYQLGGHAIYLADRDSQMGRGEPIADTARVLSGYVDAIMVRTFAHAEAEELAAYSRVPVINGLTDRFHPCQLLADLLTIRECFPDVADGWGGMSVAWLGDGNNMANSWIQAACLLGFELRLAVPEGLDPDAETLARAQKPDNGARVILTRDPAEAVAGVQVVTTDVWASMGQEDAASAREAQLRPYQVDGARFREADPNAIFLHCLPAHRGEEVTSEVIDGPMSRVFQEAENRLHVQKALLLHLLGVYA